MHTYNGGGPCQLNGACAQTCSTCVGVPAATPSLPPCVCLCVSPQQDYYELGVILTRKKLFTQATNNLEKAKKLWDGEESDLAQVGRG